MLFWKYLRQHRRSLLTLAVFCVIFAVVFYLYRLPLAAVLYPTLLCIFVGGVFLAVDFGKVRRKHAQLTRLRELSATMLNELPPETRIDCADYQAIIRALKEENADLTTAANAKYQDMVEYYTLWAHQIKTPIAAMRLTLQNEDSEVSRRLQADLQRIEQYVEMVLAFLRLESPSSDYVFKAHSVDVLVRGAVKKFSQEFIGRKISLEYEPIERTVITDEKWFSFVLEQLISNALKYTREGSIRIDLDGPATLRISDTGIGIDPADLPRIFENGYTGKNGRQDKQASGIGLYLCKRICDALGVGISAKSELGVGTTIMLDLEQYQLKTE